MNVFLKGDIPSGSDFLSWSRS